jgi:hypothetical protein
VVTLTRPPLPRSALAMMSLPSGPVGGVATMKVESMVTLPPLALLRALAEMALPYLWG